MSKPTHVSVAQPAPLRIPRARRFTAFLTGRNIALVVVTCLVAFLTVLPLFFLLWNSFKPAEAGHLADLSLKNFTLTHFLRAYANPRTFVYLVNTIYFALGSMAVALLFGGITAFLVERTNTPFRNVVYGLMFIPLVLPGMLKAIAWVLLLSPTGGMLNQLWLMLGFKQPLFDAYSMPAMWWVEGLTMTPLVFFLLGASLRSMDPTLEEAAYTSGAGRGTALFRVTFRLMTPALAAVALLMFVRGIEAMDVPLIMGTGEGIRVYATQIYLALRFSRGVPEYGEAFVLSWVLIVLALAGVVLYQRVMARTERYATVTGKGYRPRLLNLGNWRPLAGAFVIFLIFVGAILPFLVLLWASLLPFLQFPSREALSSLTLNNYQKLFAQQEFMLMIKNSAILSVTVSVGVMLLATLISWIILRLRPKGARVLDVLAFLPYTVPGVALSLSFMILFLYVRVGIYGTIWIMVLAFLVGSLPLASRFTNAGVSQIHRELEDAAYVSGASFLKVMRRVLIPLIFPSLMAGALYVLVTVNKWFSMAVLLTTPDTLVLPVWVWNLWEHGSTPLVGALAVLMTLVFVTATIVSRKLAQRRVMVAEE